LVNYAEAEDTVQEVLLRLWTKRDKLHEYNSIEAFAMIITKNLCLDKLKSKKSKTDELTVINEQSTQDTPHTFMEISDTYENLNKLINQLPDQQRMIIQLRDIEGLEFEEIAEISGLNENTIRVNLSRARKKVREAMLKTYDYEFTGN
ncbi:MAG: sigma-70 family RNA polymerase sigma factor, partial [Bacteroidales bacterium]|nr:sigma-70 family RNA polymerase sigma factor [Bacteroidales bacterium]